MIRRKGSEAITQSPVHRLAVMVFVVACAGPVAEARARSCFEALSLGDIDAATQCVAADRRERLSEDVKQRADHQMKGCHTQVRALRCGSRATGRSVAQVQGALRRAAA